MYDNAIIPAILAAPSPIPAAPFDTAVPAAWPPVRAVPAVVLDSLEAEVLLDLRELWLVDRRRLASYSGNKWTIKKGEQVLQLEHGSVKSRPFMKSWLTNQRTNHPIDRRARVVLRKFYTINEK